MRFWAARLSPLIGCSHVWLEFAKSAEADLPSNPESRQSQRDALRGLLSSVLDVKALQALMTELLAAPYGQNDFIGLVRILPKPRVDSIQPALEPMVNADPIRLALAAA